MVMGRTITNKQVKFAFYRPSALIVARTLADLPALALQCTLFTVIMYFMCGLAADAGKFFIQLLFVFVSTLQSYRLPFSC